MMWKSTTCRIRGEDEVPSLPQQRANEEVAQPLPVTTDATDEFADFNAKRDEWRARFRAALASATKESDRGND